MRGYWGPFGSVVSMWGTAAHISLEVLQAGGYAERIGLWPAGWRALVF